MYITYLGAELCAGIRKFRISKFHSAIYAKTCGSGSEVVTLHWTRSLILSPYILTYGLEGVNLSKSLAAGLEFCWSRVMYKIFNVSDFACAETILFYMGMLPISYQIDLCKLRL